MVDPNPQQRKAEPPDPMQPDDSALVRQFKQGDDAAFGRLVERYEVPVRRLLFRLLWNIDDADEATQDVFLRVFEHLGAFRGDASFKTWIMRIATNRARDWQRRIKRRPVLKTIDHEVKERTAAARGETPLETVAARERREAMQAAMERLPFLQRAALVMKVTQEMKYREIARVLDTTEGSVKASIHEARKKISQWMGRV